MILLKEGNDQTYYELREIQLCKCESQLSV